LAAWAADIEESIGIAEKTLESFSQTLDRMADKSSKEGLFGTLSGNAAAFEATKAQYVRGLQESINEIKRKIREAEQQDDFKLKAELEIRLGNLEGSLQEASERIDPILEGWGDSLGDYIANGIVYGFDQGESPAKAFANFLKRELYTAIASALSKQFTLSLSNIFGGGSGGADFLTSAFNAVFSRPGSGAAAAGVSPTGAGSSGGTGTPGIPGMDMMGMAANGLSWLGGATGLTGLSSFAAGMGMTSYTSAAAMTGLADAGLVTGVTNGAAASAGSVLGAVGTAMPYIAAALFAAQALGLFDKKPSDKTSAVTVDTSDLSVDDVWDMGGKKAASQEQKDANTALSLLVGSFAQQAGLDGQIVTAMGARDGTRLAIEGGFDTPMGAAAGGRWLGGKETAYNYGNGEAAIKAMLNDLVDEGTLPQSTIAAWRALREDSAGVARDSVELVSTLNLLVQGYDRASIERANLLQQEGEALESAMGRMVSIENALKSTALPGTELANNAGQMVAQLQTLSLSAIPASIEQFRGLIEGLDLTTSKGRETYVSLMNLAPAFVEIQKAQETLYSQLLTDDEKTSRATDALSDAFRELGVSMPRSRDGLRSMIDAQDQTTQSGAILRAQLLGLVPAFLEAGAAVERATEAARGAAEEAARTARQLAQQEVDVARRGVEEAARSALQLAESAVVDARNRAETVGGAARGLATDNLNTARSAADESRQTAESSASRAVQLAESALDAAISSADQFKFFRQELIKARSHRLARSSRLSGVAGTIVRSLGRLVVGTLRLCLNCPMLLRGFLSLACRPRLRPRTTFGRMPLSSPICLA
jgi:hypothetical protein